MNRLFRWKQDILIVATSMDDAKSVFAKGFFDDAEIESTPGAVLDGYCFNIQHYEFSNRTFAKYTNYDQVNGWEYLSAVDPEEEIELPHVLVPLGPDDVVFGTGGLVDKLLARLTAAEWAEALPLWTLIDLRS